MSPADESTTDEDFEPVAESSGREVPLAVVEASEPGEQIILVVPARPEMWSVVRMTASAIANRLDFSFEEVEDLRLAVTELCGSCAIGAEIDAACECQFDISDDTFKMHCKVSRVSEDPSDERGHRHMSTIELSQQLLEATVDNYVIDTVEKGMRHGYLCKGHDTSQSS